jgi:DNA-binding response OmpR family regulator
MLTARADETDRLIGLELGADDYIVKPFSPRELVARIRAVLRRATNSKMEKAGGKPPPSITVGDLSIDPGKREVVLARQHIRLTAIQFDLLAFLGSHPGRVFTRMQLLTALQGQASECYERTIDAHVKNLRRALGDDHRNPQHILTVRGVGYKLLEAEACDAK